MKRLHRKAAWTASLAVACAAIVGVPGALAVHGGDREVSVASNDNIFSQNKQNEPALAVDANHPWVLASGANDNIDLEACNAGDDTTCPFTPGVGVSGLYFSDTSGDDWIQPQFSGNSARTCLGAVGPDPECAPLGPDQGGMIGTLPWYFESGLVSDGDPALAFGPRPGPNGFHWSNGSRLYYANLTSNVGAGHNEQAVRGYEAIAVSRIDAPASTGHTRAIVSNKNNWLRPVIASQRQSQTTFADKEQIWADNAASSKFFGTVYICFAQFRANGNFQNANAPVPFMVITSRDGGNTWTQKQLTPAATAPQNQAAGGFGISGCTIRTDSTGVAYVFGERFGAPTSLPTQSQHVLFKSFDGGRSWTKPQVVQRVTDPCFVIDPVIGRCVEDGIAGARNDLAASPSVDIANGAPTGSDATNLIVDSWADGRDGLNNEHVMVSYSNGGANPGTWSAPTPIETAGDRGYYAAPGISPNGRDVYVVYNAFTTPFRNTTSEPRSLLGVVLHANVAGGAPTGWTELHRGMPGDPRGSSQNNLQAEFLGDYVYAVATRTYGAAVWNDVRNVADCPAIDAWRMSLRSDSTTSSGEAEEPRGASRRDARRPRQAEDVPRPAPQQQCPATFGNTDIFGGSWGDPSP